MSPQSAPALLGQIIPLFCEGDSTFAKLLGLTDIQFAEAKVGVFAAAFVTLAVYLYAAKYRFTSRGFTFQVWWACFCLLVAISVFQVANIISVAFWRQLIPCPYDTLFVAFALFMGLYAIWFYHLGQKKTGTLARYFSFVVLPLYGDVALNVRQATITSVRGLLEAVTFGAKLMGHLLAHV